MLAPSNRKRLRIHRHLRIFLAIPNLPIRLAGIGERVKEQRLYPLDRLGRLVQELRLVGLERRTLVCPSNLREQLRKVRLDLFDKALVLFLERLKERLRVAVGQHTLHRIGNDLLDRR
ncbi:MAG: hypothetical protein IKJ04_03840, partial [Clostridia bacterium]|nr:hypothetical protein [Clostridia bacterium]